MITITASTPQTAMLSGTIPPSHRVDDRETPTWTLTMQHDELTALAADLDHPHPGTRLYTAIGTIEPLDGEQADILEVGSQWSATTPTLVATVEASARPEPMARYVLDELTPADITAIQQYLPPT